MRRLIAWLCLAPGALHAAPPSDQWVLTFAEEFDGLAVNGDRWSVEAASPGHILSSRWPENLEVKEGVLNIRTRRQTRGGKEWTTGHLWTRRFRQKYGYFEARMKIGAASGLNNAFWLTTRPERICEIDITEAQFPGRNNVTVHKWTGEHVKTTRAVSAPVDLSRDFHVYGLEWDEKKLTWYFDGQIIEQHENVYCHEAVSVVLSTAVLGWLKRGAGLDGSAMVVDYVRVYARP